MAITTTRSNAPRPAKDEWGVYDPEQAGLAALYARLDSKDPKAVKAAEAKPAAKPAAKIAPVKPSVR